MGGVGTRGFIALPPGRDDQGPLFLQVKKASSVLDQPVPTSLARP
jgi:hypothetical protein